MLKRIGAQRIVTTPPVKIHKFGPMRSRRSETIPHSWSTYGLWRSGESPNQPPNPPILVPCAPVQCTASVHMLEARTGSGMEDRRVDLQQGTLYDLSSSLGSVSRNRWILCPGWLYQGTTEIAAYPQGQKSSIKLYPDTLSDCGLGIPTRNIVRRHGQQKIFIPYSVRKGGMT
jgi:hypothetical protein